MTTEIPLSDPMTKITGQESEVSKRSALSLLCALFLSLTVPAAAQQPKKIPTVVFLALAPRSSVSPRFEGLRQGLRDLGYVEGKNIVVEYRSADEKPDRLTELAAELVHVQVDVIVTGGEIVTRVVKKATSTIPIVMTIDPDPVASGFVASLARPGGNITGLSNLSPELSGKRLELLKEIVPRLSRVAVFGTSSAPGIARGLKEMELAAGTLGAKVQYFDVLDPKDFEIAFRAASNGRPDAVLTLSSAVLTSHRKQVIDFAEKSRLPAMYTSKEYVEDGGLMSYSANIVDLLRRSATYVDKILKGAKPADLPVEQATKFEFIVNLKAAKKIGVKIPLNMLAGADKVIK
jgi:putative ABC transport system substrate-binding protein